MKLATKTLLAIVLTFLGLTAALFAVSRTVFLEGYERLEREDASRNVSRAMSALTAELDGISALNVDWSSWDDSYDFMATKDPDYIRSTLNIETLSKLRLNVIMYLGPDGKVLWARALDHAAARNAAVPKDIGRHIRPGRGLMQEGEDGMTGLVSLSGGVLMVSSHPVLTSEGKGQARGSLVMGRFLDADAVRRLSETTHMELGAILPGSPDWAPLVAQLSPKAHGDIMARPVSDRLIEGYGMVRDIYGKEAVILKIGLDRAIYNQGRSAVTQFILYMCLAAIVAAIIIMALIETTVLRRLKALGRRVVEIGSRGDLTARMTEAGKDELGELTQEFNSMMASLDELDRRRRDAEEELRAANEELEARVRERTADLEEANAALRDEITERARVEGLMNDMTYRDHLTGLPNRALFVDRLSQIITRGAWHETVAGVLFLDIDRFKVINDTLGHTAGDELIKKVAVELEKILRSGDTVARMGGDEFTLLLQDLARPEDIPIVIQNIFDAFDRPVPVMGHEVFVGLSIGVAVYPFDGQDTVTLLKNADLAMYQAKGRGGNAFEMYNPVMGEKAYDRLMIGNRLRGALEKKEFTLFYQPQIDLASGRITGAEALIRWQDPEKGLVMPGCFIPLAEETGVIAPMGEWTVFEACAQARALDIEGFGGLSVSVNISGRMFTQSGFAGIVANALRQTGLPPGRLVLEITESVLMTNIQLAAEVMRELKALGVRFSIDDFGTGYSSLAYLRSLPISELKIDRSFVREIIENPDDQLIVTAIIRLAQSLNLSVLAEGVETEAQLAFLAAQRCDMTQGYLFAKPLPFDSFKSLLAKTGGLLRPGLQRAS